MRTLNSLKKIVVSFAIVLILWQIVFATSNFNQALFPSPLNVWKAFLEMLKDGVLLVGIGASMFRFGIGYLIAIITAVILGLLLGWFRNVFEYVNPVVQLIRPISPIAWIPFIVLWFGIGDIPAIVIIFLAAFFPVLLSTVSAVRNVDKIYLKVATNFGIKQPHILTKIIFPSAFPQIANGLHIALGSAWVFLVAGEMVGAQSGLGYLIIDARNNLRPDRLLATIIMIGIIGLLLDTLIKQFERWIMVRWGYDERGGSNVH